MGQLIDLTIRPGLYTDATARGAEPYWKDGDKIRFRNQIPEQIGGWQALQDTDGANTQLVGLARAIHDWASLDNQSWVAIGTHLKLYLLNTGHVYDITPLRDSGTLESPFAISGTTLTVTHPSHGEDEGDFVHFDAVDEDSVLDGEHRVARVLDVDSYEIDLPATVILPSGAIDYEYEIHVGRGSKEKTFGYGVGPYGGGTYGTPRIESALYEGLRTWALDNWGEDLMASPVEGPIYWWDRSTGPSTRAQLIEAAPATNRWMMVSPEDRHLLCFGAFTGSSDDAMLIRWSDQENFNDFLPSETNTAGDKRLDAGSRIVTAIDTRREKLVFTDEALYSMQFIGGNAVFGFSPLGRSVTIVGQNAAAQVNGVVYFMGTDDFFVYDGLVRTMPCPIRNRIFDDLDTFQGARVYATVNRLFTEILWLYPSAGAADNDRYAIYNYRDQVWYFGSINRTALHDQSSAFDLPYGVDSDGQVYLHEVGSNANGEPIVSWLESYDVDLGTGDQMMHVSRLIPDFLKLDGTIDLTLKTRRYPQSSNQIEKGPYSVASDTQKISVRARNRQIALRVTAASLESDWRMGTWRAEVRPHGQR